MRYEVAVFFSIARREIRYIQARQDPTSLRFPGLRISQAFEEQRPGKIGVGCPALARASFGQFRQAGLWARRTTMNSTLSLAELDDRIAVLRDNLRQLVEQAAAASGSQNEERIADRIAQQEAELDQLVSERDSRAKK
jgi:hypothetical protein